MMYRVILTDVQHSDTTGLQIRRNGNFTIKDTLVLQGPGWRLFGFICQDTNPDTTVEASVRRGPGCLMDIDRGRTSVHNDDPNIRENASRDRTTPNYQGTFGGRDTKPPALQSGRWPNNVIFVHDEGCAPKRTKEVRTPCAYEASSTNKNIRAYGDGIGENAGNISIHYGNKDGREEMINWNCTPQCRVQDLDHQSGERPGCTSPSDATPSSKYRPGQHGEAVQGDIYGDTGGASRFHYQARSLEEALHHIQSFVGPINLMTLTKRG